MLRTIPSQSLIILATLCLAIAQAPGVERVILDTDLGNDVDDAGTLAVLHALADRGDIEILAVGIVNGHSTAIPLADAINTFYGRGDLPLGTISVDDAPIFDDRFSMGTIAARFPHDLTRDTAPDVVDLYRRILAAQDDHSVTLVVVGQATNIANLLRSGPDAHSPLTGVELMDRKLKFYAAGGNGRDSLPDGRAGWNYTNDIASAAYELDHLPTGFPTVFAGGAGQRITIGSCYLEAPADHIVRQCYEAYFGGVAKDRPTWDQQRLVYASLPQLRGNWTLSPEGTITMDVASGDITWHASPNRRHAYTTIIDAGKPTVAATITDLMMHGIGDPPAPQPEPQPGAVRINFQPTGAVVPAGYLVDDGAAFADRGNGLSYGWLDGDNRQTRDRGANADQRLDTLNHMQNTGTDRVWELALAPGDYQVHLAMGDPRYADQTNNVQIENQALTDGDGVDLIDEFDLAVTVSDGRLTIRPGPDNGPVGAKILFLDLVPVEVPDPIEDVDLVSAATFAAASDGWDRGGSYALARAHDGDAGTEVHSQLAQEQWLEYDFGSPHALGLARIREDDGGNYSLGDWRVQVPAGDGWVDALSAAPSTSGAWQERQLSGIVASRVRLVCNAPAGSLLEIYEFECYGHPVDGEPTNRAPQLAVTELVITGTASDPDGDPLTVRVNGQPVALEDGRWRTAIPVGEGRTDIDITVEDDAGGAAIREVGVEVGPDVAASSG